MVSELDHLHTYCREVCCMRSSFLVMCWSFQNSGRGRCFYCNRCNLHRRRMSWSWYTTSQSTPTPHHSIQHSGAGSRDRRWAAGCMQASLELVELAFFFKKLLNTASGVGVSHSQVNMRRFIMNLLKEKITGSPCPCQY